MNELMRIFEPTTSTQRFDQIQISIASPERIRSWSFGAHRASGARGSYMVHEVSTFSNRAFIRYDVKRSGARALF